MSERLGLTPSQTVGPFLHLGLVWEDGPYVVPDGTPGAVWITGVVTDGTGAPVPDALVETWQADPDGRFDHPDDPRGAASPSIAGFRGYARSETDSDGRFRVLTVKPGLLPTPEGATEAPHIDVSVLGRGLLTVLLAAALVTMLLLVTFDLDRPTRGLITVPSAPLASLRASMVLPPAAAAPTPHP
jgi:protocatechuate 3,4-dioxygenase alpha subunit